MAGSLPRLFNKLQGENMEGVFKKKDKKNKMYYAPMHQYHFSVPKLDDKGNKIPAMGPGGQPRQLPDGSTEYVHETFQFKPWKQQFSDNGYWCVFEVTPETPKHVAEELEKDAKARNCTIMDEAAFIKATNPDLAEHMKTEAEHEAMVAGLQDKMSAQAEEIARLKEQLKKKG
jgi:hypothetical protein